ncbi:MAG: ATP-binding protein [Desulfobacterales bacterium]|jgi:signal transduction histidine kinase
MKRIFFTFFIFVITTLAVLEFVFSPVVDKLMEIHFEKQFVTYARELVKGTFFVTIEDLRKLPSVDWTNHINALKPQFGYPVLVEPYEKLELSEDELNHLLAGQIIVRLGGDIFHQRIGNSDRVLTMGPFPELEGNLFSEILVWSVIIIILGLLAMIWAMPFWRKLGRLSMAAEAFGNGDFSIRVKIPARSSLAPLADAFNSMADRVQQLINSHKELTSAVSHELRTPISRMRFGLEMLETASKAPARRQYLTGIHRDVDELDVLVTTLLTHARFDRVTPDIELKEHAIAPWLLDVAQKAETGSASVHYHPIIRVESENLRVRFEPQFMEHAVANLLKNAARHATTRVDLILEQDGDDCVIHVDDDGPGVREQDRERIFEPFARLDSSRSRDSGGFGLGLAIVNRILTWHGGQVTVLDSPLGGARFTIRWNCVDASA